MKDAMNEHMNEMKSEPQTQSRAIPQHGVLGSGWLTTGLLVLVVFMLAKVVGVMDQPAMAEMAVSDSGYTMMTTNGGADEILVLVDSREESILVYRAVHSGGLELLERESLGSLFTRARAQAIGGP